jgi:integrase
VRSTGARPASSRSSHSLALTEPIRARSRASLDSTSCSSMTSRSVLSPTCPVVFWKVYGKDSEDGGTEQDRRFVLRYYTVFNVAQTDGIEAPASASRPAFNPIEECERVVSAYRDPPRIEHGGGQACYVPFLDRVRLPARESFNSVPEYYSTLFHELTHSTGTSALPIPKTRFSDFSVSLLEEKLALREIKSARGRERWVFTLRHLIDGTEGVKGFGEMYIDQIKPAHVEQWKLGVAGLIGEHMYRPATTNGWLAILRIIMKRAKAKHLIAADPTEGVKAFDTSEHPVYTEEQPNALTTQEMRDFLGCMFELYPQHYAMTCLGYATGLRPSSVRALRRKGETPDVLWDDGVILIRRSATLGEIMNTTKTKYRQRISVASVLTSVLRWHVETQLHTPQQLESDLLFPAEDGGLRSEACPRKPFAQVAAFIGLKKKFTPKGLRRTFNDAARVADLEGVVTMSISGHRTERMRDLYSSVSAGEQRDGIGKVLHLASAGIPSETASASGMHCGMHPAQAVLNPAGANARCV